MLKKSINIIIATITVCLAAALPVAADNHALLIGIGQYKQRILEGPPHDVAALARILEAQYDFPAENIRTLVNGAAVRRRILAEIQQLTRRTRPGDRVFIYFSGHGTSRRDELLALPLPHSTGALVPADFNASPGQPVSRLLSQLIIGQRDLRPTLAQLDRDREVMMVFDTCFSGNTVRAVRAPDDKNSSRYLKLAAPNVFGAEQDIGKFEENLNLPDPYPYRNIFYISASTDYEVARDIRRDHLHLYPTFDGNPHGVLTDSLLRVLAGQRPVDTDKDGRWSQIELFTAVKADVKRRFTQTPQALPRHGPHSARLYARPFFVRTANPIAASPRPPAPAQSESRLQKMQYRGDYSASHALVVGIDKYRHWPGLEYAAKDAGQMAVLLQTQGFRTHLLTDEQATLQNIRAKLKTIQQAVDKNSRVVFYFAGHGLTEDLPGGGERGYIVPVDADAYDWQKTMLAMDQLNRTIKQFKAKHILMAFDSCYSGLGLIRSIRPHTGQNTAYIEKMMRSRSIQILTAGSRSEAAIEAAGHGLFTDHLLAALAGAADINGDGYITATEIYATVRPSITRKSYSRQTPQFGYIEGNGDIIFHSTPHQPQSATIAIDTGTSGIDVWAGTTEIGHRLAAGRHQLRARAGPTTIIVKKGGRTLYRRQVRLSPSRIFPIQVGSPIEVGTIDQRPDFREAFSMLTIADSQVADYSNSIAYDLDQDGREEIVTASGNRLYAYKASGEVAWQKEFSAPITLNLIDDWYSEPAIGLTVLEDDKVHLMLLNQSGEKIWRHTRIITRYHRGKPDGSGSIARLADIDLDGRKEIIALAAASRGLKPRGLMVYGHDAVEMWRYAIGPSPQDIVIWPKDRGRPDIIIGTFSPGDGNHEVHNNTRDSRTYVISIDGYGRTNWIVDVGGYYNGVGLLLADPAGTGGDFLYAHKYASSAFRQDAGAIYRISRSGTILDQFKTANSILSIRATPAAGVQKGFVYAADSGGNLYQLDARLNLLQKKSDSTESPPPEIRLVGVHDYNGDGSADLLYYSFNRLLGDRNPLTAPDPNKRVFYANLNFKIISQDFSRLLKSVSIAKDWSTLGGFTVKDFARPEMAYYPFMALSDKIQVYNY